MSDKRRILIIDDDEDFLVSMRAELRSAFDCFTATSIAAGLAQLARQDVDLVLLDVGLDGESGLEGIRRIIAQQPAASVAMLSGNRDVKTVVEAIRAGAVDYLTKPVDIEDLVALSERAVATRVYKEKCDALLRAQPGAGSCGANIVFRSRRMVALMEEAGRIRAHRANVLIVGETGTGKELLARYLNESTRGRSVPFVAVNCAAIPEHLLESELFGHEAGAFTSALKRRIGKFELAHGGDIFLDEISTMKLDLQVKLLRVLQEREFSRLGSNEPIRAEFRAISASNQPLDALIERGDFRADLYHRLRVVELTVPPLRERPEDIPLLVNHFIEKFSQGATRKRFTEAAMARMMEYAWPGNVRELANVVQSLIILSPGDEIDAAAFPSWTLNGCRRADAAGGKADGVEALAQSRNADVAATLREHLQRAEKGFIERMLALHDGDKSKTARTLGLGRTTLYQKLREYGLMG